MGYRVWSNVSSLQTVHCRPSHCAPISHAAPASLHCPALFYVFSSAKAVCVPPPPPPSSPPSSCRPTMTCQCKVSTCELSCMQTLVLTTSVQVHRMFNKLKRKGEFREQHPSRQAARSYAESFVRSGWKWAPCEVKKMLVVDHFMRSFKLNELPEIPEVCRYQCVQRHEDTTFADIFRPLNPPSLPSPLPPPPMTRLF